MLVPDEDRQDASPLLDNEIIWRERYTMLESHGYRLRQRYRPDWKPTWLDTKRVVFRHEDYDTHDNAVTMDAVRISDGRNVFLKRILSSSSELTIHRFLSEPERLQEPKNHTVALLDEFADENDSRYTYMVLPLLRPYYHPEFYFVDEVVDLIKQLLEGLVYMHKLDVAHRDCSILNIMMDAEPLYPKGFHPPNLISDASGIHRAYPKRRRDVGGVLYYFIDFGISSKFGPDDSTFVVGVDGQDTELPELSYTEPYSPFRADVFIVGNLIRKEFLKKYTNLGFLEPLVEEMTAHSWLTRCTSGYALELFNRIVRSQPWYILRWRLKRRDAGRVTRFFQDVGTISRESTFLAKKVIGKTLATSFTAAILNTRTFLFAFLSSKQTIHQLS